MGTRIVDLEKYDHQFAFDKFPIFEDERIFYADAASKNLYVSYNKYNALVVNKIPHGGGVQLPRSHRVTLFLYIVPDDWTNTEELEITIPATEFLLNQDEEILKWLKILPDIYKHYEGEVESAKKELDKKRKLVLSMKKMATEVK